MSQMPEARASGPIKSQLDLGGGLFLLGIAALGLAGGFNLPTGTLSGIGSGLVPRVVSIMIAGFGVLLIVHAFLYEDNQLEKWHLRGPVFVLGAVLLFALVIRGSDLEIGGFLGIPLLASIRIPALGLIVAGPLSVIVSSLAAEDTNFKEITIFAVVMTLLSGLLFKEILNLPIPWDPMGIIPGPVDAAYGGIKWTLDHAVSTIVGLFTR